jgi:acyl carrier protein
MSNFTANTLQFEITEKLIAQQVKTNLHLYGDPIVASMQETGSNSFDTIQELFDTHGIAPKPYQIFVSYKGDFIEIMFVDEGMGMTRQQFDTHYWKIGNSSKTKDANQTGKFGIGAKAILAVNPSYTIATKSIVDGVTHAYTLKRIDKNFDGDILPVFEKEEIQISDLEIQHGTVTRFQVRRSSETLKAISKGLYQLALTGCQIDIQDAIENEYNFNFQMPTFEKMNVGGKTYLYTENSYYKGKVIIGNIPYPQQFAGNWANNCPFLPTFDNEDLQYNETREYLMKDYDDTYGNKSTIVSTYTELRDGLKKEYQKQKGELDCTELEYYKYYKQSQSPTITLNNKEIQLAFTNVNLVSPHKKWKTLLMDANFNMPNIDKVWGDVPFINDRNFRRITDDFDGFGKEKAYIGNIAHNFENFPLLYNGRGHQNNFGYYFDVLNNNLGYSTGIVYHVGDDIDSFIPTDDDAIAKIIKGFCGLQIGEEFEFMKKVVLQYFETVKANCINLSEIEKDIKEEGYKFKKFRNIKSTYSGKINVYVGINYPTKRQFSTDYIEDNDDTLFVYTVGRNSRFGLMPTLFENLKKDYKNIKGKEYKEYSNGTKVRFLRFNKTDMNKKTFRTYIEEADNVITEEQFTDYICKEENLWKPVLKYSLKNEFGNLIQVLKHRIGYTNTLQFFFDQKLKALDRFYNQLNLVDKYQGYTWRTEKISLETPFNEHIFETLPCFQSYKDKYELVTTYKVDKIQQITNDVSKLEKVTEWLDFLHSLEAFELSLPILKKLGIDLTDAQIKEMRTKLAE